MRVLVFHGYLLRGTGSNVYNASLAQALRALGHEVHLFCQDRGAARLAWVDAVNEAAPGPGTVTVHTPEIGGLLPVFVADRYEGFEVKTFPDLSDEELDAYIGANVDAVRGVVAAAGEPEAALANHLIMGPAILARAGVRFATKVHGSDLSYTVRPHPERFVPFAREGTDAAAAVLVGSRHTAVDLWNTVPDPGLPDRTRLGPPGVDVHRFRPRSRREAEGALAGLAERLEALPPERSFGRDGRAAAAAIRGWAQGSPRIVFVGKLLRNKGVHLLLEAWPQIRRRHPGARLLLVGFGEFRAEAEAQIAALGEIGSSVAISGRLEHDEVADLLPDADTLVMPSIFPEAFGMVAAEAAACGVLPVSAAHSGMLEVSRGLAAGLGDEVAPLLSFALEEGAEGIAERVCAWLELPEGVRSDASRALSRRAGELWSWERVAKGVIAASNGRLDLLERVPE